MFAARTSAFLSAFPFARRHLSSQVSEKESRLVNILRGRFANATKIEVNDVSGGCGSMYQVVVHTPDFKDLLTVQQHKQVTSALKDEIKSMHGITIATKAV